MTCILIRDGATIIRIFLKSENTFTIITLTALFFGLNWILILCCHFKSCSCSFNRRVEGWQRKVDPDKRKNQGGGVLKWVFRWLTLTPANASRAVSASSPSLAQCVSLRVLCCEGESEIRPCTRSQPLSLFRCVFLQLLWVLESWASSVLHSEKLSKTETQESGTRGLWQRKPEQSGQLVFLWRIRTACLLNKRRGSRLSSRSRSMRNSLWFIILSWVIALLVFPGKTLLLRIAVYVLLRLTWTQCGALTSASSHLAPRAVYVVELQDL